MRPVAENHPPRQMSGAGIEFFHPPTHRRADVDTIIEAIRYRGIVSLCAVIEFYRSRWKFECLWVCVCVSVCGRVSEIVDFFAFAARVWFCCFDVLSCDSIGKKILRF